MTRWALVTLAGLLGPLWVAFTAKRYQGRSRPLAADELREMRRYFAGGVLRAVRVADGVGSITIAPIAWLRLVGLRDASFAAGARAITLGRTIVVAESVTAMATESWRSLLFHELVHATQFAELGVGAMCRRYIAEWHDAGHVYMDIELERDAYALQDRRDADPGAAFDADALIRESVRTRKGA